VDYVSRYLDEVCQVAQSIDRAAIDQLVQRLAALRERGGRLFVLGLGGSAANASHAVNDFRKIAGLEAYTPVDNVAELTARINDEGWDTSLAAWLQASRLSANDLVLILSVGGGDLARGVSVSLIRAAQFAREVGASVCGIVGRDGGFTASVADVAVIVPTIGTDTVTALAESFQAVVWHLLVTDPRLKAAPTRWESLHQ
jgi:D-sedoheptulose 7-phosphate isomerase